MLKGIDISNHQAGIQVSSLGVDFAIMKATEGIGYVDWTCDDNVQDCINNHILWGFYHFARENNPEHEAQFFYDNCTGYIGHGIPVLDYETQNYSNREWCERFITKFHDLSGVWPMVYTSASRCGEFSGSWIPDKCGLWLAGYPYPYTDWTQDEMPYDTSPWEFAAIWQFTSSLHLGGYALDGDYAYMDERAWMLYAGMYNDDGSDQAGEGSKSCEELAREVIDGKWGNGWNRQHALDTAYGDGTYEHVQAIVNRMLG